MASGKPLEWKAIRTCTAGHVSTGSFRIISSSKRMIRKSAWPSVVPSAMMSRSLPICRCFLLMAHTPSEIGDIAARRTDGSAFSEREPGTLARCLAADGILAKSRVLLQ